MKKTLITLAALAAASVAQAVEFTRTETFTLGDFTDGKITLEHALDFTGDFEITGTITIGSDGANDYGTPMISTNTVDAFSAVAQGGMKLYVSGPDNGDFKPSGTLVADFRSFDQGGQYATPIKDLAAGDTVTFTYTYTAATKYADFTFSHDGTSDHRYGTMTAPATITGFVTAIPTDSNWGLSLTVKSVPEPATATLSLLALAGLAARRRRK